MGKKFYTNERNVQILLSLLKANGINRIIASPGATNFTFVGSVQNDPFFRVYSCVDERSAAYMACGMAAESGSPVVLSCTGSTASRDYYPGMTEAFYRKLPILAVTSHQGTDRIGHLKPQQIDRRQIPHDVAKLSVELPIVKDDRDEEYCIIEANKAILELRHNGGGPVHINLFTTYSKDFSVQELPKVKAIQRYHAWDRLPEIPNVTIAIYVGCHRDFTDSQIRAIDRFCSTYNAIVICDHTSGYYGKYRLLPTLTQLQSSLTPPLREIDLMIHIGEVSAATFSGTFKPKEIWRVSEDGELRDTYKRLTNIFQMSEEFFFTLYGKDGCCEHSFIDQCTEAYNEIYNHIPELPFSNIWAASQLSKVIPEGSVFHISTSNTRRCWNMFPLPNSVSSSCNVGCCGIDGCTSTLVGASLVKTNVLHYLVTGDLAFFYDLNVLGNRHISNNVRILLVNNGSGAEFQLYHHFCHTFGDDTKTYMAAIGHNGFKSPSLVRHFAEDLGFKYLSASNKDEYNNALNEFTSPELGEKPIVFEIFTTPEDESIALKVMSSISADTKGVIRKNVIKGIKTVAGGAGIKAVKKLMGR